MEEVYIEIRYLVVEGGFWGDRGVLTCYSSIASLVRSFYHLRGLECLINLLPHSLNHLSAICLTPHARHSRTQLFMQEQLDSCTYFQAINRQWHTEFSLICLNFVFRETAAPNLVDIPDLSSEKYSL